ncbi:phosphoglycerate mutase [Lysobacter sp. GX 14042]|uniref:phosphoglycerate mutase n=1 Tax=Lysobacter sp. GX 14042 TaxID=2907155 RepID=UPI001F24488D|nr:phosphoglycerate mutase [Lysobacter sp. GX 14042]MCE7031318.1 phosphoglycerate mutase [Lysobacter sp. GX 14042]
MAAGTTTLLLPERARFGGQRLGAASARWFARATRRQRAGACPQRHFTVAGGGWPVAAATRQLDAGDAAGATWLRADPVHVRADINGARLLSHGDALLLDDAEAALFLEALRPLFSDSGLVLDAPVAGRWYLRLPPGTALPPMTPVDETLGDDLFENLPAGPEGRRWRALLSEAQVTLHNHPHNTARMAAGLAAVNSLWFWGGGALPATVASAHARVLSDDHGLRAMATLAGATAEPLPPGWPGGSDTLVDLRHARDLAVLERDWFAPILGRLGQGGNARVAVEFADGPGLDIAPWQRLRVWRKPLRSFIGDPAAGVAYGAGGE